jgi:hypothetical protein
VHARVHVGLGLQQQSESSFFSFHLLLLDVGLPSADAGRRGRRGPQLTTKYQKERENEILVCDCYLFPTPKKVDPIFFRVWLTWCSRSSEAGSAACQNSFHQNSAVAGGESCEPHSLHKSRRKKSVNPFDRVAPSFLPRPPIPNDVTRLPPDPLL